MCLDRVNASELLSSISAFCVFSIFLIIDWPILGQVNLHWATNFLVIESRKMVYKSYRAKYISIKILV